jgi:hypothetical protein
MNAIFDITRAESLRTLGFLTSDELVRMAEGAVAGGCDNENIFQLSICSPNERDEANALFEKVKLDYGSSSMTMLEALHEYARFTAASILNEEISPSDGAKLIWKATLAAKLPDFHELDGFIYAASEIDDRPSERPLFEAGILREAERISSYL